MNTGSAEKHALARISRQILIYNLKYYLEKTFLEMLEKDNMDREDFTSADLDEFE